MRRVQYQTRVRKRRGGVQRVLQLDLRVLQVGGLVGGGAHGDVAGLECEGEGGALGGGFLLAGLAVGFYFSDVGAAIGDLFREGFEGRVGGVESEAEFAGVLGFGELVQGQAGAGGAVAGFNV